MPDSHPLLPNLDPESVEEMLRRIGARSVDELFEDIPEKVRLKRPLKIAEGAPEHVVRRELAARLATNTTPPAALCFLGGGVWPHYVPAAVDAIVSRQEFYTSYTPYQAEISQGVLQALFEYQSLMCQLLEMEACNSSMYDWASAAAEAIRMSVRVTGRDKALVAANAGPDRLAVVRSYLSPIGVGVETVGFDPESGRLDMADLERKMGDDVASLYFESPNFLGVVEEDAERASGLAHDHGSLAVTGVDPISLSLLKPPGSCGADVAVGEGQPLGIPMNYGGPHLGILAVKDLGLARSMPGRLIGMTTTVHDPGQKAFSMVLQTREQHIRREAATSNICTNQALMAIAAAAYLSLLGKNGLRELGKTVISNSHYAAERLSEVSGLDSPLLKGSFFKEFAVGYRRRKADGVFHDLARKGVLGGYPVPPSFGLREEAGMYCFTEVHTPDDIERLAVALEGP